MKILGEQTWVRNDSAFDFYYLNGIVFNGTQHYQYELVFQGTKCLKFSKVDSLGPGCSSVGRVLA